MPKLQKVRSTAKKRTVVVKNRFPVFIYFFLPLYGRKISFQKITLTTVMPDNCFTGNLHFI